VKFLFGKFKTIISQKAKGVWHARQPVQEALQMQRDHATCHKYEISHLKRLAIGE